MTDEILEHRGTTLVRRLRLEPGEAQPWHRDPFHRVSVVLGGDALSIEFQDGSPTLAVEIRLGEAGRDEPEARVHRGVNTGTEAYEELTVFFLDSPDSDPQPL